MHINVRLMMLYDNSANIWSLLLTASSGTIDTRILVCTGSKNNLFCSIPWSYHNNIIWRSGFRGSNLFSLDFKCMICGTETIPLVPEWCKRWIEYSCHPIEYIDETKKGPRWFHFVFLLSFRIAWLEISTYSSIRLLPQHTSEHVGRHTLCFFGAQNYLPSFWTDKQALHHIIPFDLCKRLST